MNRTGQFNSPPSAILRYGVAVFAVTIVLGLKLLLDPLFDVESPFLLFFTAVIVSALYGGFKTGALATILSGLISDYLFLSPYRSFFVDQSIGQNLRLVLFLLEGIFISNIIHQLITVNQRVKLGQQALQESEARYRLLIESVRDYAIFMLDPKGVVITWNQGAQRLKGYRAEEIIGEHFSRFYLEEDIVQGKPDRYLQIVATKGYLENEGWRVRKDGSRFWAIAIITALRDEKGNLTGFSKLTRHLSDRKPPVSEAEQLTPSSPQQAYAEVEFRIQERTAQLTATNRELQQQIEERRKAEAALQESERRFRSIFNQTFQFMGLMQPDGIVIEANDTALNFGGLQREDVIDRPLWEARWWTLSPEIQERLKQAIQTAANNQFIRYEVEVLGAGDTVLTIDFSIKPILDESGQVVLLIPEGRDISQLKQAEQTLQSFFDAAPMMMGIVELIDNHDILHIADNRATAKFFGTQIEQMRNRLASEMGSSEQHIQQWIRYYREAERTQAPVRFKYPHITQEDERCLLATVCSIPVKLGTRSRFAYIVQDITEQKLAEAQIRQLNAELEERVQERTAQLEREIVQRELALQELQQTQEALQLSLERFRIALQNSPIAVFNQDRELRYTWIYNPQLGYKQEEVLGKTDAELMHPDDATKLTQIKQRVVLTGNGVREEVNASKIGEFAYYDLTVEPLKDDKGEVIGITAASIDITERKRTEAKLRIRAQQQAAIANLGQRALSGINLDVLMNEATHLIAQILNVEYCEVLELLPDGQKMLLRSAFGFREELVGHSTINTGAQSQAGYTLLAAEPVIVNDLRSETRFTPSWLLQEHQIISGLSTIIAGVPQPFGALEVHTTREYTFTQDDIHFLQAAANIFAETIQRQRARETLQRQSEELAVANRLKDEFLATISHELRTPLNSMLGWAKLLPTRNFSPETVSRAMETISRNTQALAQLIEDVLDMSDIIRGRLNLEVEPVSLDMVIEEAIASITLAAEAKNIQICSQIDYSLGIVLGDATRLQQIVWNLLSNSVKFTPNGGRVEVRLTRVNKQAQIEVSDTGRGISPNFLPFVFDRFRQEDGSITRAYGGLGLGLAIVRYLVELHGGTIQAESLGSGQGATFSVLLPLA